MLKAFLYVFGAVFLTGGFVVDLPAQASRKSVSSREVNGTCRYNFTGKFKRSSNEIRILSLGKGKVQVGFDLMYPFIDGNGEMSANMGELEGVAEISGDTATYSSNEFGECRIIIKFVKPGTIKVSQDNLSGCGFGHNVSANGTFRKVSRTMPSFESSK